MGQVSWGGRRKEVTCRKASTQECTLSRVCQRLFDSSAYIALSQGNYK